MNSTVYIVTRPTENKFGWTPDLTDAARYGKMQVVFEPDDRPQFNPNKAINTAHDVLKDFGPDDYLLWPGGSDPIAVMICTAVASDNSDIVNVLRWERNFDEVRDRRKGWYMPVKLNFGEGL